MNAIQKLVESRLVEKQAFVVYMGLQHSVHKKTCNKCSFEDNPKAYFDYIFDYMAVKARLKRNDRVYDAKFHRTYFENRAHISSPGLRNEDDCFLRNHKSRKDSLCCPDCIKKYNPNKNKRINRGVRTDPTQIKGIFDE